nr:MAG TPA: hypothetical protein [Caudoviricetes sp.]
MIVSFLKSYVYTVFGICSPFRPANAGLWCFVALLTRMLCF